TMFWARPQALRPFLALSLSPDDYPEEPLPTDVTILHAMERLITCVALESGFDFATTFLPDYTR
ncbi:rhamnan synthesis F family protein, partial [Pseudomonas sp. SIMBA_021]|uniref:rhamnan synthesis F family protein n=1 Tax=Pseudomonas sp. SIMBA_021 TaxID=3085767 RepID=UPI00397D1299